MSKTDDYTVKVPPKYDVMICTPGTEMKVAYMRSLLTTLGHLHRNKISFSWCGGTSSLVHQARENTLGGVDPFDPKENRPFHGKVTYRKLFWIDSDIHWTWEDFKRLYESPLDIVCGSYLAEDGVPNVMITPGVYPTKQDILAMKDRPPFEVTGTGFGFLCVKQGVFERIPRPWFTMLHAPIEIPGEPDRALTVGEDLSWCFRATQAGFKIHFDPSVLVSHAKTMLVKWEE